MLKIGIPAADTQRLTVVNEARKDGWTALMIASTKGEQELVRVLVNNGADINKRKTGDGCTGKHMLIMISWKALLIFFSDYHSTHVCCCKGSRRDRALFVAA